MDIDLQVIESPLTKEEAKEQFNRLSAELNVKHTYSFDEYWDMMEDFKNRKSFRESISELQDEALSSTDDNVLTGDALLKHNPVKSSFADGLYIREIFNPANQLIITKVHKKQHTFFLMEGEMSIITEGGVETIRAPHNGITEPDTKRLIFPHTDCRFVTVHATTLTDIDELEKELVSDEYENDLLESDFVKNLIQNK
tara:strand:- start:23591 stop:24184 length:594 start_codon:yes stop_codon:yes gene_type:complete